MNFKPINLRRWLENLNYWGFLVVIDNAFTRVPNTIGEALRWAAEQLTTDSPRLDAEVLLADCLERDRAYLYTWPERVLNEAQACHFQTRIARRTLGEPIAYILGQREFWSLDLAVEPSTLIPRADTEVLVESVLDRIAHPAQAQLRLLDLGTGTGAIAIALAKELPNCSVLAVDYSAAVVELAQRNRARHNCHNLICLQSNWFERVEGKFDWIVSNPPYIDAADPHLAQGDVRFEPPSALVAGDAGLADIAHIIDHAVQYLHAGGRLHLEHGWQQKDAVQALFNQAGFIDVFTVCDYAGHPRVTGGCWRGN